MVDSRPWSFKLERLSQTPPKKTRGKRRPNPLPVDQRSHLRPDEYALRIGVSRRVLDAWMKGNLIPYAKIGHLILIDPKAADEAIGRLTRKAKVSQERRREMSTETRLKRDEPVDLAELPAAAKAELGAGV
jgi:hypothetical protein